MRRVLDTAVRADARHQPLGDDAGERLRDQERVQAQVRQPRDGADRAVRVQGGKHQVARERRLNRHLGRLLVADLAD